MKEFKTLDPLPYLLRRDQPLNEAVLGTAQYQWEYRNGIGNILGSMQPVSVVYLEVSKDFIQDTGSNTMLIDAQGQSDDKKSPSLLLNSSG